MKIKPFNGAYLAEGKVNGVSWFVMRKCRRVCMAEAFLTVKALRGVK